MTTGRERDGPTGLPLEQAWQEVQQLVDFSDLSAPEAAVVVVAVMEMGCAAVKMTLVDMMKKAHGLKSRRAGEGR